MSNLKVHATLQQQLDSLFFLPNTAQETSLKEAQLSSPCSLRASTESLLCTFCPVGCTRARLFGCAHECTSGCLPPAYTCTSVPFSIGPVVRAKCTRQMAAQTCNRKPGCVSQSLQKTRSVYPRYGPPSARRATDASLPVVGTSTRRREGAPRLKWTPETS